MEDKDGLESETSSSFSSEFVTSLVVENEKKHMGERIKAGIARAKEKRKQQENQ
jgi:hypothetical protein